jgi:hypothetical protein
MLRGHILLLFFKFTHLVQPGHALVKIIMIYWCCLKWPVYESFSKVITLIFPHLVFFLTLQLLYLGLLDLFLQFLDMLDQLRILIHEVLFFLLFLIDLEQVLFLDDIHTVYFFGLFIESFVYVGNFFVKRSYMVLVIVFLFFE